MNVVSGRKNIHLYSLVGKRCGILVQLHIPAVDNLFHRHVPVRVRDVIVPKANTNKTQAREHVHDEKTHPVDPALPTPKWRHQTSRVGLKNRNVDVTHRT